MTSNRQFLRYVLLPLILGISLTAFGQTEKRESKKYGFCDGDNFSYNNKNSFKELREFTVAAQDDINVDAGRNGGISVRGENRSDVVVRACVQTVGDSAEEATARAKNVRIETGSTIRAENGSDEKNWSVSFEIAVPRNSNLNLTAQNGGIAIRNVEGNIEFTTKNGGVSVAEAAGSVRGKTQNGGVSVTLAGSGWRGSGLDVETTNGGVSLKMPENYAARIETGTVNGGFVSEIPGLAVTKEADNGYYRSNRKKISTDLNGGGATVRVVTINGGVKISTTKKE